VPGIITSSLQVDGCVHRHRIQPCTEFGILTESGQLLVHFDKDFLDAFFGAVFVSEYTQCRGEQPMTIGLHERLERAYIPGFRKSNYSLFTFHIRGLTEVSEEGLVK
jgi:hypothetical protein